MMKKGFLMILTLAVIFFSSCVNEDENPASLKAGETVDVKFRVGLETSPKTRTSDQSGYSNLKLSNPDNYSLRYMVKVYVGDKNGTNTFSASPVFTGEEIVDFSTDIKAMDFSCRLTSGTAYTVIGWADFVETPTNPGDPAADKFYDTSAFPNVTLLEDAFIFNEEAKDAYFGVWSDNLTTATVNVTLKRPFGKIRFLVSDYYSINLTDVDRTALDLNTKYYQNYVDNSTIYTTLNLATGEVSGNADGSQRQKYPTIAIPANTADRILEGTPGSEELVTFWDYILAPSAEQITNGMAKPRIEFQVNYDGTLGGNPISASPSIVIYADPRIVVERNKLTTVRANLFGDVQTVIQLSIDDDFEAPELEPLKLFVRYTDGTSSTISTASDINGIVSFDGPLPIRAVTINREDSIYIGTTKPLQNVTLKFIDDKTIGFRDRIGGLIPVNSIAELELINKNHNTRDDFYVLTDDIDLLSREWTPIGKNENFTGKFNGDGHTISNLKITSGADIGLFGLCETGTVIENLGISGNVSGTSNVGGIAGASTGTITACSFNGTVTGTTNVGSIAGEGRTITACHSSGTVTGGSIVGGLVGYISGSVTACYSTATVGLTGTDIGSLYGSNSGGTVTGCFTNGPLSTTEILEGGVTLFDGGPGDWPSTAASPEWATGDGKYWKSLGDWNGGTTPEYPKLWWEQ